MNRPNFPSRVQSKYPLFALHVPCYIAILPPLVFMREFCLLFISIPNYQDSTYDEDVCYFILYTKEMKM